MSWRRCVRITARRYEQKCSTEQESLLPPNGGMLRTFSIQRTFEKFQQCSLLPLLYLSFLLNNSPPSKPFLLILKSQQGLARLITKTKGLRRPRVRRLSKGVLSPRIRARVKRSSHWPRPSTPRMLSRLRMWSPRPRMLSPSSKQVIPNLRQLVPRRTPLFFSSFFLFFFGGSGATIYNGLLFFCLMKRC